MQDIESMPERQQDHGRRSRLIALSFLLLFVELALIRWTGSNVVYLSYFSNFVLLGSFLGIGIGFLRSHKKADRFPWALPTLAVLVAFVLTFPVTVDRRGSELIYFGAGLRGLPTWVILPLVFVAVATVMAMIAQGVAREFAKFEPLRAYRLDIVGSILGIVAFSLLSFAGAPPVVWGTIASIVTILLLRPRIRIEQIGAVVLLVGMLGAESLDPAVDWSPYYKISSETWDNGAVAIRVNGIPHQRTLDIEDPKQRLPIYERPYELVPDLEPERVLIIGAGSGNDVALALRKGARAVDAVEIDPKIQEIGVEVHPNRPYDDPRVTAHIGDGRAFLERTSQTYDLIIFALPDSLTLVAGQSALRLESYLFTREAFESARDRLAPGGVFTMYNYYRQDWLIQRLAGTLRDVFGAQPCVTFEHRRRFLAVLIARMRPGPLECPSAAIDLSNPPPPSSDDHPFLYLRTNTIPSFYLLTIALILAASLVAVRGAGARFAAMAPYRDLFFLGVGFLLLETKSVTQFALLFGTTWFVNALVFTGILASVLVAIEIAHRFRPRRPALVYAGLLAAIGLAWAIPQAALLELDVVPRFLAAVALAFTPILLANLVFAERFRDVPEPTTAFGANLLGAMVGGVLEYVALVTGYRALLIVVALAYGAAFLTGRHALRIVPAEVGPQT